MKRTIRSRGRTGQIEKRTEYVIDDTGGYDAEAEMNKRAKVTGGGQPYISMEDFFEVLDEAELHSTYSRAEPETLSTDELHMQWALTQDPDMTTADYMHNCKKPGWGPRPARQILDHPQDLRRRKWTLRRDPNIKGDHNELVASTWLLKQGYDVYRNVCSTGLVDLVALRSRDVTLIDVKSTNGTSKAPSVYQQRIGVPIPSLEPQTTIASKFFGGLISENRCIYKALTVHQETNVSADTGLLGCYP